LDLHVAELVAHGQRAFEFRDDPGVVLVLHRADAIARAGGRAGILQLLLQESGEVVRAEPGVQEHLAVVLGDPAPQLGVDRDLALTRLR
jgi:hypothetical protein